MRNVTWNQVVLYLGLAAIVFAAVILLVYLKADVSAVLNAVLTLVITALAFVGYDAKKSIEGRIDRVNTTTHEVKDLSNGRLGDVMDENRELRAQITALALQIQPPPVTPVSPAPESTSAP